MQTTDDHWKAAIDSGSHIGSHIAHNQEPSIDSKDNKKTRKKPGSEGSGYPTESIESSPPGLEQNENIREKSKVSGDLPPLVPPSETINANFNELIVIWQHLTQMERANLIICAREIARYANSSNT